MRYNYRKFSNSFFPFPFNHVSTVASINYTRFIESDRIKCKRKCKQIAFDADRKPKFSHKEKILDIVKSAFVNSSSTAVVVGDNTSGSHHFSLYGGIDFAFSWTNDWYIFCSHRLLNWWIIRTEPSFWRRLALLNRRKESVETANIVGFK